MKKLFLISLLCFSFLWMGCMQDIVNDPKQVEYLAKVNAFPLEFEVSKDIATDAWGRAQSFIGRFSSMKLQSATDYMIQTYNPTDNGVNYGYNITKTPLKDTVQITVQCSSNNMFAGGDATKNAHILAYYISSGELPYPNLIAK
jgi:hypothetical protein